MKALIWRELRLLRTPIVATLTALAVTEWAVILYVRSAPWRSGEAIVIWWLALPIMALMLGAQMFARERAHRELQFASLWPISRLRVWAARVGVGLGLLTALFALTWAVSMSVDTGVLRNEFFYEQGTDAAVTAQTPPPALAVVAAAFALFCVGIAASVVRTGSLDALGSAVGAIGVVGGAATLLLLGVVNPLWGPYLGLHPTMLLANLTVPMIATALMGLAFLIASAIGFSATPAFAYGRRQTRTICAASVLLLIGASGLLVGVRIFGEPPASDLYWPRTWGEVAPDGRSAWLVNFPDSKIALGDVVEGPPAPSIWKMDTHTGEVRCIARAGSMPGEISGLRAVFQWGWEGPSLGQRVWTADLHGRLLRLPIPPGDDVMGDIPAPLVSPSGELLCAPPMVLRVGERITPLPVRLPETLSPRRFTPDESAIYCEGSIEGLSGGRHLLRFDLASGAVSLVANAPPGDYLPVELSPDLRWAVGSHRPNRTTWNHALSFRRLEDGRTWRLEDARARVWPHEPWSPDGRYCIVRRPMARTLDVLRLTDVTIVTSISSAQLAEGTHPGSALWSGDGRWLGFLASRRLGDEPDTEVLQFIYVMHPDGSGLRRAAKQVSPHTRSQLLGWRDDGCLLVTTDAGQVLVCDPTTGSNDVLLQTNAGRNAS